MSFGVGALHTKSTKQKLYTKSSTEAELVGVSEYLPYHIWLLNFLKHQGYNVKEKLLFQDNEIQSVWKLMVEILAPAIQDMSTSGSSLCTTESSQEISKSCIALLTRW